jgi:hypothetical protein
VALHGGEFDMASRVWQGTSVSVRLPWNCETVKPVSKPSNVARLDRAQEQALAQAQIQAPAQAPVQTDASIKKTA